MSEQLLQINYAFDGSRAEFERTFGPLAAEIAAVPGLRWKVWLVNEAESSGGGWYLFDDESSLRAYVDGPVVSALRSHPAFRNVSVQRYAVLEGPTQVTRGPVGLAAVSEAATA